MTRSKSKPTAKPARAARSAPPKDKRTATQRLDRPPKRVYVTLDELGPNKARVRKSDAWNEIATGDEELFGSSRVYEYRLVERSVRYARP